MLRANEKTQHACSRRRVAVTDEHIKETSGAT